MPTQDLAKASWLTTFRFHREATASFISGPTWQGCSAASSPGLLEDSLSCSVLPSCSCPLAGKTEIESADAVHLQKDVGARSPSPPQLRVRGRRRGGDAGRFRGSLSGMVTETLAVMVLRWTVSPFHPLDILGVLGPGCSQSSVPGSAPSSSSLRVNVHFMPGVGLGLDSRSQA